MSTSNINKDRVLEYLSKAFHRAIQRAVRAKILNRDNSVGTDLHTLQVDFCYMQDDIMRGPGYIVPKRISEANDLIDGLVAQIEAAEGPGEAVEGA